MELPIAFAQALPEFDCVFMMMIEELSKVVKDKNCLLLKHVSGRVENLFCCIDGICDNNDFRYVLKMGCLINATFDSKEFNFGVSNVNHMMKCFDNQSDMNMDMCYRQCNIVLDTSICDHECVGWSIGRFNC